MYARGIVRFVSWEVENVGVCIGEGEVDDTGNSLVSVPV